MGGGTGRVAHIGVGDGGKGQGAYAPPLKFEKKFGQLLSKIRAFC